MRRHRGSLWQLLLLLATFAALLTPACKTAEWRRLCTGWHTLQIANLTVWARGIRWRVGSVGDGGGVGGAGCVRVRPEECV